MIYNNKELSRKCSYYRLFCFQQYFPWTTCIMANSYTITLFIIQGFRKNVSLFIELVRFLLIVQLKRYLFSRNPVDITY